MTHLETALSTAFRQICLSKMQHRILNLLADKPRVSRREIYDAMWPHGCASNDPRNVMHVHLNYLRKRLAPVGLDVEYTRGQGYSIRLSAEGSDQRMAAA